MKIALLGYGKMGHEIEKVALEQGNTIHLTIDNEIDWTEKADKLKECDVAIEFSIPAIVLDNIHRCLEAGIPIVVGTTGWHEKLKEISEACKAKNGTLFYASNYSIGVNVFFDINQRLAALLEDYPMYSPKIVEIHHTQKLDSPSGTALSLVNDIISGNSRYSNYTNTQAGAGEIEVQSIREGNVPGTHTITWGSEIDQITITHEAFNRSGFAIGAVMAANWVNKRKGVFTMKDLINL